MQRGFGRYAATAIVDLTVVNRLFFSDDQAIEPCFTSFGRVAVDHSALGRLVEGRDERGNFFVIGAGLTTNAFLQIAQSSSDTAVVLHSLY